MTTTHSPRTFRALSVMAEQADARLTATINARTGRDRWTMRPEDSQIPEIQDALRTKINADEALLTFMRTTHSK